VPLLQLKDAQSLSLVQGQPMTRLVEYMMLTGPGVVP